MPLWAPHFCRMFPHGMTPTTRPYFGAIIIIAQDDRALHGEMLPYETSDSCPRVGRIIMVALSRKGNAGWADWKSGSGGLALR